MVYEITAKGSKVFVEGLKRWVEFTEGAKRLLMVDTVWFKILQDILKLSITSTANCRFSAQSKTPKKTSACAKKRAFFISSKRRCHG
jgi:hypothetical protein